MGRTDFASHVIVFFAPHELTLPTVLFKAAPWTAAEVSTLEQFYQRPEIPAGERLVIVEHPLDASKRFLSADFYSGDFPAEVAAKTKVNFTPRTDDHPYFGMLRKSVGPITADAASFTDPGSAHYLNIELDHGVPMDWAHFFAVGALSLLFVTLCVILPLRYSRVGRQQGATALPLMGYFACLGAGFIIIELVLIQKFTHVLGSPLYTYATVIFSMLLAAGIGSAASEWLGISEKRRWQLPFCGALVSVIALIVLYGPLSHFALSLPLGGRIVVTGLMIFPIGFFLGMPFPLGVLAIRDRPAGAIAWAWGMNGLFTNIGGLIAILASIEWGFTITLLGALALYVIAFALYPMLHRARGAVTAASLAKGAHGGASPAVR